MKVEGRIARQLAEELAQLEHQFQGALATGSMIAARSCYAAYSEFVRALRVIRLDGLTVRDGCGMYTFFDFDPEAASVEMEGGEK